MKNDAKISVIAIVGPTASGKTALSIEIAKIFDGEIISADSMQIYKGMDIATAKPTAAERGEIKHHLVDFLDTDKTFSVAQYCDLAHKIIRDIHSRGKMPVLVGGTGLYIDSLLNNIIFSDADSDDEIRNQLQNELDTKGVDYLLQLLTEFDPESAKRLEVEKNPKRIIRAIEIYKTTGSTMTWHNLNSRNCASPYKFVKIGLTATDRQFLYDRINRRVDIMVDNGLVDEAKESAVRNMSVTSSMAIGHKELMPYFNGDAELDTCVDRLKMQTRRYAKRQLTWFNKDKNTYWLNIDTMTTDELINESVKVINKVLFDEKN